MLCLFVFFFFQAEDGIRDYKVTGVQTCALPIWTATDHCNNSSTASQVIHVVDTTAPVISALPAPTTIECTATPSFATPTATDACDASPTLTFADVTTAGSCPQNHDVTRTWTAAEIGSAHVS